MMENSIPCASSEYAAGVELRNRFDREAAQFLGTMTTLVVAVRLPSGATELITNTSFLPSKVSYYQTAYDESFRLKANGSIRIINFMIV